MKIQELHLLTNNIDATENFYTNTLNVSVFNKSENSITFIFGSTKIIFTHSEIQNPVYHVAFEIPNNKIDEAYEWFNRKLSIIPVSEKSNFSDFKEWNAKSFYFYDNNNNLLECIGRFDLKNSSEDEFDSKSILYASEIGIVTDNVEKMAKEIQEFYGLEIYSKQPAQENFTVLGDENGLFVLVDKNRNWFPTKRLADFYPLKIIFESNKKILTVHFE